MASPGGDAAEGLHWQVCKEGMQGGGSSRPGKQGMQGGGSSRPGKQAVLQRHHC
jgi:hypothetical protein